MSTQLSTYTHVKPFSLEYFATENVRNIAMRRTNVKDIRSVCSRGAKGPVLGIWTLYQLNLALSLPGQLRIFHILHKGVCVLHSVFFQMYIHVCRCFVTVTVLQFMPSLKSGVMSATGLRALDNSPL